MIAARQIMSRLGKRRPIHLVKAAPMVSQAALEISQVAVAANEGREGHIPPRLVASPMVTPMAIEEVATLITAGIVKLPREARPGATLM